MNYNEDKKQLEMGSGDVIVIEKLFGPTIMSDLRITADVEKGWIIERRWIGTGQWIEWCTLPGQIDAEFNEQ